jgi:hypothetical protein
MKYTPQLTEPIRIDIGKMLIAHETIKLLPYLDYEKLKMQIDEKWRDFNVVENVRDFWNLIDSLMMGYKLKNIAQLLISSMQLDWSLEDIATGELRFTSDITKIIGFSIGGKTAKEVSSFLHDHIDILRTVKENNTKEFLLAGARFSDPLIIEKHTDNTLHVHDGNGRLLKAIIENQKDINAYVGTHNTNQKSNHWIPTSYLMRLKDERNETLLIRLLKQSDNAIFEFENRADADEQFKQKILSGI